MPKDKIIGIVGGMGPYAGLDLNKKIFDQTIAGSDQEHLRVILFSFSPDIPDRTAFVLGRVKENPAEKIYWVLTQLEEAGAQVAGIPCNTSHSSSIFNIVQERLKENGRSIYLINMVDEVARWIAQQHPEIDKVGVLATNGAVVSDVYGQSFIKHKIDVIYPDDCSQEILHTAIYAPQWGIKSLSNPVSNRARISVLKSINHLVDRGAQLIILGCTELPLAVGMNSVKGIQLIDTTLILARALINWVDPNKLNPYDINEKKEFNI